MQWNKISECQFFLLQAVTKKMDAVHGDTGGKKLTGSMDSAKQQKKQVISRNRFLRFKLLIYL
jgi:hypothetical protein